MFRQNKPSKILKTLTKQSRDKLRDKFRQHLNGEAVTKANLEAQASTLEAGDYSIPREEGSTHTFFQRVSQRRESPLYQVIRTKATDDKNEAKIRSRLTKKINPFLVDRLLSSTYKYEDLKLPPFKVRQGIISNILNHGEIVSLLACVRRNQNIKTIDISNYYITYDANHTINKAFEKNASLTTIIKKSAP